MGLIVLQSSPVANDGRIPLLARFLDKSNTTPSERDVLERLGEFSERFVARMRINKASDHVVGLESDKPQPGKGGFPDAVKRR